ncbi:hypothetical protein ACQ86N_25105 [Puia sp. P3]|uniref:hypothetical protein n=1 Tax=Puia sp. P3 TaxID=3423952 RepID=UPI003D67A482
MRLSILYDGNTTPDSTWLRKDGTTIGAWAFARDVPTNAWSAVISYNFEKDAHYDFIVRNKAVGNTALRYTLPGYRHIYTAPFTYQRLLAFNQSLGMQSIDITPSHNYIYFTDDSVNILTTKNSP